MFVWNYRGYGLSTGSPTPANLKSDSNVVLNYLRTELNLKGKVAVYGRSLGGIPASHLSSCVDVAFIDRTFGDLEQMALSKFNSRFSYFCFWLGSFGWQV